MSWIGGKKSLRELIVSLFPLYYERYIEVFGGAGWILFHKNPGNDFEVYNDYNSLLVNLYRCVREKPNELMDALRYCLNSREDFDYIKNCLARDSPVSDVQKAAWFYQQIRYSYASGLTSFGSQPHDIWSNFPLIEQAHRRLAKVVIENKDFEKPPLNCTCTQLNRVFPMPALKQVKCFVMALAVIKMKRKRKNIFQMHFMDLLPWKNKVMMISFNIVLAGCS